MEDFLKMTRKQLQALCKKHGVPANLKNAEMAARLSLLFKDDEAQAKEPSSSGGGSSENVKVEIKKKVRFHPENDVYEFVDLYMEATDKGEARRDRASRRRGMRNNENAVETANSESKEIFGNQVRLTRSRKSVVIVSPPLRKRAKTGGDDVIETVEKESCGDTDVVDSFATKASKVNKFDETVVAGKNEKISGFKEVNSLDEEHTRSKAEVPRRIRAQRKFKGHDVLVIGSDDSTRPVIEHDLLAGNRGSVHDVPLRKSCRVAMHNISHIPEYQKIGIGEVFGKKVKKKTRKEFPTLIPDSDESIALAREEEKNVNQILGNSLPSKLSTSISPTVAGLKVDSGKERQRTCESPGVELPVVKPLRRSKRKTDGYCALGLSEDESLRTASNHQNPPLNQTKKGAADNCHEAVTSNVTHDCSEVDLVEDPGLLSKMLDGEQKHHKCRKVSARLRKGDTNCAKISSGDDYLLNKTDVPESKDLNSDGLLGITETAKDGICSAQSMTPTGSDLPDGSVEACLSSSEALLEKESTICSVEEAPASNSTIPLCVSADGESQITACENDAVWRQTLIAGPAKRALELEELDNPSEFSNSVSYGLPPAGCTGDVSIDAEQKHAPFDDKHDHDTLLSTETRTCKGSPTEGVPGEDEAMIVLNRSATKAEDAHDIINDGPITGEVISKEDTCRKPWSNMPMKQNAIDGENKETFSTDAEESTKERHAFLNEKSILCGRSNEDSETGEQDRTAINEWQLTVFMPGPEVVKKLYGDIKMNGMASEDHSPENKQDQHLCVQNTYGVEGKPDGNWKQILEFGQSMPEHGLTCTELYYETRNTERVSCDQTVCQVDGQPNICEHLDDEEVKVVQFSEPLKVKHHIEEEEEEDSAVGIITRMDDSTSEVVVLSTEAGRVSSQKGSLSPVAAIDEHATNHQATEPSQELDKETNDSVLCFSMVNKISGDEGVKLPSATKNEFAQDGHGAYTDEVCTTLHVTNSEVDHSRNAASDDGDLVGSDSSLSFHESQVERDSEFADVVDYSSLAYSPLSVETFTVDRCPQDPNATFYLNGVSQDIGKEFAPEYMQRKRLSLYHGTSQPEEVIASSSEKGPCPDDDLVGHAIVIGEKATDESNINEYSIAKSEMELESSIGSQVMLSITEVTNELEDDNTIPQVTNRQTYDTPGYSDDVDESSLNFVNRCDAELLLMRANSEAFSNVGCETGTEVGDPASVDPYACEDYGLKKSSSDKKEIIKSSDTHGSYNDAGMPRESASGAKFPFDGLLKEIADYFNGTNSKEEVVFEKSALGDDIKEKVLNSNAETYFEVPIKTCYGRHVEMNECKCIAGIDVEVYASPLEGHGEQINENADYDQVGDLFIKDDRVDQHEDIWEERCSGGLSGYESGKKSVNSPDIIQNSPNQSFISFAEKTVEFSTHQSMTAMRDGTSFKPVSPRESTTCLLSSIGINVLALEKDVHSDEQNAIVNSDSNENKCEGNKGVQIPQILSSSNGYEMFEPSTGVIAQHISRIPHCAKNNQEPVPLSTDDILELNTNSSNKFGVTVTALQHIVKVMKENLTPFPKTDSLKRSKPVINRKGVLKNLQNN